MSYCLVVDDSAVVRKIASRMLLELGFSVGEATNGREALDRCADRMPDVVLLDWTMPEMDGLEVVTRLRQLEGGRDVRVVFCTTRKETHQIVLAMEAGADEYIMKPFDRDILSAKLSQVAPRLRAM